MRLLASSLLLLLLLAWPQAALGARRCADFARARVAVLDGSAQEVGLGRIFPEARLVCLRSIADLAIAVEKGKADALCMDEVQILQAMEEKPGLVMTEDAVMETGVALAFPRTPRGERLRGEFDAFLDAIRADGTFAALTNAFFCGRSWDSGISPAELPPSNGYLRLATCGDMPGFTFYAGERLTGRDVELALLFCRRAGYGLKVQVMDFGGIIPSLQSGSADFAAANLCVTEERQEAVYFSSNVSVQRSLLCYQEAGGRAEARLEDFATSRIGVAEGTIHEARFRTFFPKASPAIYRNFPDLFLALKKGLVEAVFYDRSVSADYVAKNPGLALVASPVCRDPNAFIFPRTAAGAALRDEFNDFLRWAARDGVLDRLTNAFECGRSFDQGIRPEGLEARRGVLRMATTGDLALFSFVENGRLTGRDVELALLFCRHAGYGLRFVVTGFAGMLPSLAGGQADFGAGDISITEERKESVYFSDPVGYDDSSLCYVRSGWRQRQEEGARPEDRPEPALEDFARGRLGVMHGSAQDVYVTANFPDARIIRLKTVADLAAALKAGKLDAVVVNGLAGREAFQGRPDIVSLREPLSVAELGFAFPRTAKGSRLREEFDAFLEECRQSGLLEEISRGWLEGEGRPEQTLDFGEDNHPAGTLVMAANGSFPPFNYVAGNRPTGLDLEIACRFCLSRGYRLKPVLAELDSMIMGLNNGLYDFAGSALLMTEERKESVDFSAPYSSQDTRLFYRVKTEGADQSQGGPAGLGGHLKELRTSFERTFLEEGRWRLLLRGLGTTCLITLASLVLGTLLGFVVCLCGLERSLLLRLLTLVYVRFFQGTPIVVVLMIFYYVLLGRSGLSAAAVAIVAFGMNFAAFFSEILMAGIESVDKGQREAALALGYSEGQAFLRFVLPQAMASFLPIYRGEAIGLLKSTSVAGYVAVQDLTKMGDIIRSRTYEAFFPLLVVAAVYFLLAYLLFTVLEHAARRVSPDRRNRTVKGVRLP